MIIASGTSSRHLQSLSENIVVELKNSVLKVAELRVTKVVSGN